MLLSFLERALALIWVAQFGTAEQQNIMADSLCIKVYAACFTMEPAGGRCQGRMTFCQNVPLDVASTQPTALQIQHETVQAAELASQLIKTNCINPQPLRRYILDAADWRNPHNHLSPAKVCTAAILSKPQNHTGKRS